MLLMLVFACSGSKESAAIDDSATPNESTPQESTPQESSPDDSGKGPTVSYATDVWPTLNSACSSCHTDDTYHPGLKMGTAEETYTTMLNDMKLS
jgi:hypothetical protein